MNISDILPTNISVEAMKVLETQERNYGPLGTVAATSIIVVTIFMNTLIIVAFCTYKNVRKLNNYFFFSLALSDLLMAILVMPLSASEQLLGTWRFGKELCIFWLCVDYFLCSASVFNMTAICIDRYLIILRPLSYPPNRTSRRVIKIIVFAWCLGLMAELPAILLWEPISGNSVIDYTNTCDVEWVDNVYFTILSTVLTVFIPFIIMAVLYSRIYCAVVKSLRWIKTHSVSIESINQISHSADDAKDQYSSPSHSNGSSKWSLVRENLQKLTSNTHLRKATRSNKKIRALSDKKTATTLGILLLFFAFSWIPWQIVSITIAMCGDYCVPAIVYDICLWLQYSNSMINPFLYIFRDDSFRIAVRSILTKCSFTSKDRQPVAHV